MRQGDYHRKSNYYNPKSRNIPAKDHVDNVGITTLKHRYHKPYQDDWRQATAYARAKIWHKWHSKKEEQ